MSLTITGGQWKGRRIATPKHQHVRPTTARLRESLFARLNARLPGSRWLDGYAGSGVMGLEALSRGAAWVQAVEAHRPQATQLRQHWASFDLTEREYAIACLPLEKYLKKLPPNLPFDVIYLDPPYAEVTPAWWSQLQPLLQQGWLREAGVLLVEAPARNTVSWPNGAQLHAYGDTVLIQILGNAL